MRHQHLAKLGRERSYRKAGTQNDCLSRLTAPTSRELGPLFGKEPDLGGNWKCKTRSPGVRFRGSRRGDRLVFQPRNCEEGRRKRKMLLCGPASESRQAVKCERTCCSAAQLSLLLHRANQTKSTCHSLSRVAVCVQSACSLRRPSASAQALCLAGSAIDVTCNHLSPFLRNATR
jgi:hypothetical protein